MKPSESSAVPAGKPFLTPLARRRICEHFREGADERRIARREGVSEHQVRRVIRTAFDIRERQVALVKVLSENALEMLRQEPARLEAECWAESEHAA